MHSIRFWSDQQQTMTVLHISVVLCVRRRLICLHQRYHSCIQFGFHLCNKLTKTLSYGLKSFETDYRLAGHKFQANSSICARTIQATWVVVCVCELVIWFATGISVLDKQSWLGPPNVNQIRIDARLLSSKRLTPLMKIVLKYSSRAIFTMKIK